MNTNKKVSLILIMAIGFVLFMAGGFLLLIGSAAGSEMSVYIALGLIGLGGLVYVGFFIFLFVAYLVLRKKK